MFPSFVTPLPLMTEPDVSSAPMNSPFEVLAIDAPVFFPNWANSENSTDSGVLDIEAPLDSSAGDILIIVSTGWMSVVSVCKYFLEPWPDFNMVICFDALSTPPFNPTSIRLFLSPTFNTSPTYLLSVDVNTFGLACIIEIDLDSDHTFAPTSFPDSMNVRPETSANTFCVDLIVAPEVPRAIPKYAPRAIASDVSPLVIGSIIEYPAKLINPPLAIVVMPFPIAGIFSMVLIPNPIPFPALIGKSSNAADAPFPSAGIIFPFADSSEIRFVCNTSLPIFSLNLFSLPLSKSISADIVVIGFVIRMPTC